MKKIITIILIIIAIIIIVFAFKNIVHKNNNANISKENAFKGVYNYCHSNFDWSIADKNPDIMYVKMNDETESEYQIMFRSYTGTIIYFNVDKSTGITKMIEYVPSLDIKNEVGTININNYL